MKKAEIIERFGDKVLAVEGFIDFLEGQSVAIENGSIAIEDVSIDEDRKVGAFILEKHWWEKGRGGIGMAVIPGIFWKGIYRMGRELVYRDQFDPKKDRWDLYYRKIDRFFLSKEDKKRVKSGLEPSCIRMHMTNGKEEKEEFWMNNPDVPCDKCKIRKGDYYPGLTDDILYLCEHCEKKIKNEFKKKQYNVREYHPPKPGVVCCSLSGASIVGWFLNEESKQNRAIFYQEFARKIRGGG